MLLFAGLVTACQHADNGGRGADAAGYETTTGSESSSGSSEGTWDTYGPSGTGASTNTYGTSWPK